MTITKTKLVALALLSLALDRASAGETRDLVIFAGQSNAVGFDADPSMIPDDFAKEEVLFWWRCGDPPPDEHDSTGPGKWIPLQAQPLGNPLPKVNGSGDTDDGLKRQYGNFANTSGGFGPEMGFAREWLGSGKGPLAIVKVAFSGTALGRDWNPTDPGTSGACYRALVQETREALREAQEADITLRLRALVWIQGESDANADAAPLYRRALAEMLAAIRHDLNTPDLPTLLGVNTRFGNGENPHLSAIITSQKLLAFEDPLCRYVDTAGAETLPPSHTHFTSAGTLEVGRRFALAWDFTPTHVIVDEGFSRAIPPARVTGELQNEQ